MSFLDDKPVQIIFISEETKYLLCTLHKNSVWQVPLNLIIEKGANVAFFCNGGSYVHLLGHLKEYDILKEPQQNWKVKTQQLLNKMKELKSNSIEEIEYLKTDESVDRNKKRQQLNTSNALMLNISKDQENKKQSKRKADSLKDEEVKRIKSSSKSKENYDKDCEDIKNRDDNDDNDNDNDNNDNTDNNDNDDGTDTDDDNKTITSENEDSDEIEMRDEKFMKFHKQEKKRKEQRKQDKQTREEIKREQKDKKKEEKKQGNNKSISVIEGGVQVRELRAGTGKIAESGKFVTIYYLARVQLKDCKPKVDKVLEGIGFRFKLDSGVVLKGLDVGIVGMKVGEKRRLIIPYKMGYV